jgi:hypothetical protein
MTAYANFEVLARRCQIGDGSIMRFEKLARGSDEQFSLRREADTTWRSFD